MAQIDAARAAWSRGFVAAEIDAFCRSPVRDETGRDHAGLLTAQDLAGWSASYEDAVTVDVGDGGAVAKPGPWSQGPVLAQILQLVRGGGLSYADGWRRVRRCTGRWRLRSSRSPAADTRSGVGTTAAH